MTMEKLKPCPCCGFPKLWIVRILPVRFVFTKYYVECRICHFCGSTEFGKHRAIKAWNRRTDDGK